MSTIRWTEVETIDLIKAIEGLEQLWNKNSKYYSNGSKRIAAFRTLEQQFNRPIKEIKLKIKGLRSQYSG